jgi:hypothetical protein
MPPTAYGANDGILQMSVSGFSTYRIEGLEAWIDEIEPVVTISAGAVSDAGFTTDSAVVTVIVTDAGGSGITTVSGVEGFTATSDTAFYKEYTKTFSDDDEYNFSVTATDGANNTGSDDFGFTIDKTVPTITYDGVSNRGKF